MNILLAPSSYAPNIGGVEEMTRGLARELNARNHCVRIVAARWPDSLPEADQVDGLSVLRLSYPLPSRHPRQILDFARKFKPTVTSFCSAAVAGDADVIHVHCLGPNTLYATYAARRLRKPLVLTTHGELQGDDTGSRGSAVIRWIHRYAFRNAHSITACSQYSMDHIPYGSRAPKTVIHNALTRQPERDGGHHIAPQPFLFCAARLTHNKGVDIAIKAFAAVRDRLCEEDLWIAGEGRDRHDLEHLARKLGVANRVRFLGALSQEHVASLMRQCLFYVCPSRNEGFGLVNLEAMAAGKAVVAMNVGGIPEVVSQDETGLLVPREDVGEFGLQLSRLANDRVLRDRLGAAGLERARLFNWRAAADKYLDVYRAIQRM